MRAFDDDEDHHDASSSAPKPNFEQGRNEGTIEVLLAPILEQLKKWPLSVCPSRGVDGRNSAKIAGEIGSWRGFRLEGSLLNGTLHWLLHNDDDNCSKIIAFDVIKRKLSEIPLPFYDFFNLRSKLNLLMVMGGYLCVYSASYLPA
ncbi:hypothetical protein JHK86_024526 [Glycine max]|nr:hypothetical protein JHK86_024526 [Glycine max]